MSDDEEQTFDVPIGQSKIKQQGLLNNLKKKKDPLQSLYLINKTWWDQFVGEGVELPSKIVDNSSLVNEKGETKDDIKENEHFVTVNTQQYQYLGLWYTFKPSIKVMLDDNKEICFRPLRLSTLDQQSFSIPDTCSIRSLKGALCDALSYKPSQTVLWRLPKDCDPNKYNAEEDLFPLLDEDKTLIESNVESGDFIKIDNESIQKEDAIAIAAKIKKELVFGGEKTENKETGEGEQNAPKREPKGGNNNRPSAQNDEEEEGEEEDDEEGMPHHMMGGGMHHMMGGMGGMGGIPMMGGINLAMLLGGGMPMRSFEEMEREEMEKAIKASLEIQRKEEEEKKRKEEEERKRKEEIENERKRIQDFAKLEEETKNEEDFEPLDADNISEDDEDDDDDDDEDDE